MRILIAEDDVTSRILLDHLLRKWGYEVVIAEDGDAAWNALSAPDAPPIALLDWMMPALSGLDVCERLRALQREPSPYVILLTARHEKTDIAEGLDRGADDYLVKPFDFDELAARLRVAKRSVRLQHELITARETIRHQATHDMASGALNRAAILDSLMTRLRHAGGGLAAALVSIDGYKTLLERYGVAFAEGVVRGVVERARKVAPKVLVGRYDVEELLLVVPSATLDDGVEVAELLRASVAKAAFRVGQIASAVTVSCGVTAGNARETATMEWLLCSADAALHAAKRDGNRVEVFALGQDDEASQGISGEDPISMKIEVA